MQDKEIISLFFSRDQQALSEVSQKYGAYCYSLAFNIVSQHEDAEECVNDTWLGAWNSIPPKKPDILKYFLAKITRGKAIDRLKKYHAQKRGADEVAVAMDLQNISSTGATIRFRQYEECNTGELVYGQDYAISTLENNKWQPVPQIIDNAGFEDIAYIIPVAGESKIETNWDWLYGSLSKGTYRISKKNS